MNKQLVNLYHNINIKVLRSEPHFKALSLLAIFGFPFSYFIWQFIYPQHYENLTLSLIASLLFLVLFLYNYWPEGFKKYLALVWYGSLFFGISFYFNFMFLKNNLNPVWAMSTMAAIFILILVVDWIAFFILLLFGSSFALYLYLLTGSSPNIVMNYLACNVVYLFLGILAGLFIFNSNRLQQKAHLEAMAALSGNVAHELRTPLLGLKSGILGLKKYMPQLYSAYENAKNAGIEVPYIRKNQLKNLLAALDRMNSEVRFSNAIIDMILMNIGRKKINEETFEISNIAPCIQQALSRYPFDSAELEAKIHYNPKNDFLFNGDPLLLEHVIFNLLKNALHFIIKADKGEVFIWLEQHQRYNAIHFKDTGQGIPSSALPHLFERFFTTTLTGTGIGLSFCKVVMKSFGGNILCNSIEGQYAEFILKFPAINLRPQ